MGGATNSSPKRNRSPLTDTSSALAFKSPSEPGFSGMVSAAGHIQTYLVTAAAYSKTLEWAIPGSAPAAGRLLWNCQPDRSVIVAWEQPDGRVMSRSFDAAVKVSETPEGQSPPGPRSHGVWLHWGAPQSGVVSDRSELVAFRVGPTGERL